MNSKRNLKRGVCNNQFDCELHVNKDWILLCPISHQVQLGVQNNFCAPFIGVKQNQYSDISFIYMLNKLGSVKRNADFPEENLKHLIKDVHALPMNRNIFNLYSELEAYGSLLEAVGTVQQQCT